MNQDKTTWSKIIYIVLAAVLALAAVFGYDIGVIQPRENAVELPTIGTRGVVSTFSEPAYFEHDLTVGGDATVAGALAVTGAVTAASFTPQALTTAGGIYASTGAFTTSLSTGGAFSAATGVYTTSVSAGALTATSAAIGGGIDSTGCTFDSTGILMCAGAAHIAGAATVTGTVNALGALQVGGGFNLSGCTLSTAGVLQCDGAATIGGAASVTGTLTAGGLLAADNVTIGGGSGSSGCTGTNVGAITCDNIGTFSLGVVAASGGLTYGTWERVMPRTAITVTDGLTISPTGKNQPLAAAGPVGTGAITAGTAGYVLMLYNTTAQTITITDTGTLMLSANWVGEQYDTLTLLSDGVNWLELDRSDN